jgi:hypothetical protein
MQRHLIAILALLVMSSAWAQQPTGIDYFAARDHARATLYEKFGKCGKAAFPTPGKEAEFEVAVKRLDGELDAMMRRMLGLVVAPKGFSGPGSSNTSVASCGVGMEALDGVVWSVTVGDRHTKMLMTPDAVLRRWLAINDPPQPELQAHLDAAFREARITAAVIDMDAWMEAFAFLPIDKPRDVDAASVFLGEGGNGSVIWPPLELGVYLRKRNRIYIAYVPLATPFAPLKACDTLRREAEVASGDRDELALKAFNKCWQERGRNEPAFAAAIRQAQSFIDDLAAQ